MVPSSTALCRPRRHPLSGTSKTIGGTTEGSTGLDRQDRPEDPSPGPLGSWTLIWIRNPSFGPQGFCHSIAGMQMFPLSGLHVLFSRTLGEARSRTCSLSQHMALSSPTQHNPSLPTIWTRRKGGGAASPRCWAPGAGAGQGAAGSRAWRRGSSVAAIVPVLQPELQCLPCGGCTNGLGPVSVSLLSASHAQSGGGSMAGCARHGAGLRSGGTLLGAGRSQDGVGWVAPKDERQSR